MKPSRHPGALTSNAGRTWPRRLSGSEATKRFRPPSRAWKAASRRRKSRYWRKDARATCWCGGGCNEMITFAFVNPQGEQDYYGNAKPLRLANPLGPEHSVMRSGLFGGLLDRANYNHHRRQDSLRLFEIGRCFPPKGGQQPIYLAGLCWGPVRAQPLEQRQAGAGFLRRPRARSRPCCPARRWSSYGPDGPRPASGQQRAGKMGRAQHRLRRHAAPGPAAQGRLRIGVRAGAVRAGPGVPQDPAAPAAVPVLLAAAAGTARPGPCSRPSACRLANW